MGVNTWPDRPCLSVLRIWPDATCARDCDQTSGACVCSCVWTWQPAQWPREKIKLNFSPERSSASKMRMRPCTATPRGWPRALGSTSSVSGAAVAVADQGATGRGSESAQRRCGLQASTWDTIGGDSDGCRGSAAGPGPRTDRVWPSASAENPIRGDGRHSKFSHLAIT